MVVGDAVGVDEREEDDAGREDGLYLRIGVRLAAILQASTRFVCCEEIRDPVDQLVRTPTLACMQSSTEVEAVCGLVCASADVGGRLRCAVEGLVWQGDGAHTVGFDQSLDRGADLSNVHDAADRCACRLCSKTYRGDSAGFEAISRSNRCCGSSFDGLLVNRDFGSGLILL